MIHHESFTMQNSHIHNFKNMIQGRKESYLIMLIREEMTAHQGGSYIVLS